LLRVNSGEESRELIRRFFTTLGFVQNDRNGFGSFSSPASFAVGNRMRHEERAVFLSLALWELGKLVWYEKGRGRKDSFPRIGAGAIFMLLPLRFTFLP